MSWMDSWSRPNKSQATPPPLYLTIGDHVPYCHSCGRVIGDRRRTSGAAEVKYCSQRCRHQRPGPLDRKIEAVFAELLEGRTPESMQDEQEHGKSNEAEDKDRRKSQERDEVADEEAGTKSGKKDKKKQHKKKGSKSKDTPKDGHRIVIDCTTVETLVFKREKNPEKIYGRRRNRRTRALVEKSDDEKSVTIGQPNPPLAPVQSAGGINDETSSAEDTMSGSEYEDNDAVQENSTRATPITTQGPDTLRYGYGGGKIRPPQGESDINGSIGGEKGWAERQNETPQARESRLEGQRRAVEREMVRKAARRGCAFGFLMDGNEGVRGGEKGDRRKCEAVMKGAVVEASFAKGEWGVRWREKI